MTVFERTLEALDSDIRTRSIAVRKKKMNLDIALSVVKASPYFLVYTLAALATTWALYQGLVLLPFFALILLGVVVSICWSYSEEWTTHLDKEEPALAGDIAELAQRKELASRDFRKAATWLWMPPMDYEKIAFAPGMEKTVEKTLAGEAGEQRKKDMTYFEEGLVGSIDALTRDTKLFNDLSGEFYNASVQQLDSLEQSSTLYKALRQTGYNLDTSNELAVLYRACLASRLRDTGDGFPEGLVPTRLVNENNLYIQITLEESVDNGLPRLLKMKELVDTAQKLEKVRKNLTEEYTEVREEIRFKFGPSG